MKRLHVDRREGIVKLAIDTLDDLWTLRNLIRAGDIVTASTHRTAEQATDKAREGKAEKKPMTLGVRVERVEWHDFDDHLRVLGTIETGPQDHGRHHTLVFRDDPGTRLTIQKQRGLLAHDLRLVEDAEAATKRPQVVLLAIDDAEAQFAVLRGYGVQWIGSLPAGGQGKRFEGSGNAKQQFYDEALKTLTTVRADADVPLLIVGPGWWREEFLAHAKDRRPEAIAGALTDGTSQGGRAGIQEALRRGLLEKVAREHRVHQETELVERVFGEMQKPDGLVAIGADETRRAVQAGAAETVLVADDLVRSGDQDDLLRLADETRAHVHVVATGHEGGARLSHLGGLAALLRFAV